MKIRIPGKCILCQFSDTYNVYLCHLFHFLKDNRDKCSQCLEEFGNGGEFELVKKEEI